MLVLFGLDCFRENRNSFAAINCQHRHNDYDNVPERTSQILTRQLLTGIPFEKGIVSFREIFHALMQTGFLGLTGVEIYGSIHPGKDPVDSVAVTRNYYTAW